MRSWCVVNPRPAEGRGQDEPGACLHRLGHLATSQFLMTERGEDWFLSGGLVLFSNCVLLPSWVCTPVSLYAFLPWPRRGRGGRGHSRPHTTAFRGRSLGGPVPGMGRRAPLPASLLCCEENISPVATPQTVYISLAKQTLVTGG